MMAAMVDAIPNTFGMAFPGLKIIGHRQKSTSNSPNGILLPFRVVTKKEPVSTGERN